MKRGFTLIELLVVIAIIGLLSSVVLASLNSARQKAQVAAVAEEFHQLEIAIDNARDTKNATLLNVTGNACTDCSFSSATKANTQTFALGVNSLSMSRIGISNPVDPWGTPYTIDENEQEFGPTDCTYDSMRSAGPDGFLFTADDYVKNVTHFVCP